MTPEEACEYLDISMDDDLELSVLERNYKAKLSSNADKAKIEEAYKLLRELYDELYAPEEMTKQKHEGLLMKFAVLIAGVFLLSFGGLIYFTYRLNTVNNAPKATNIHQEKYDELLNELKALRESNLGQEKKSTQTENNTNPPADFAALTEKVMPSMVYIQTDKGQGSGFFVSSNGDILTNYHVIEDAGFVTVTPHNGQSMPALIKDFDKVKDMALLKINNSYPVNSLKISNTLPKQGESVLAIGNPRGYSGTVSNGIVSAIREMNNNLLVQFTAPVSPGSSGGALINLNGEVVGMPTWIRVDSGSQNLNFAVASTILNQFFISAVNKPAKALPTKKEMHNSTMQDFLVKIPGVKFIRKDDGYDIYLHTDSITYNRQSGISSFITLWWPTEKSKATMRKDPHFYIPPGKDLGICMLLYCVDFSDNTYVHLKTTNFCTDNSTIAREYEKPANEIVWRTPKKGSRIDILMKAVKKELRIR